MKTINILVADHSEDTRKELTDFFEKRKDMQLVGSTDNGQDACRAIRSLQPDIVLLDVVLPVMDGFLLWRRSMRTGICSSRRLLSLSLPSGISP